MQEHDLARAVDRSGYRPDAVLAIARGLLVGGALTYAFGAGRAASGARSRGRSRLVSEAARA